MNTNDAKATVHFAGDGLFVGIAPSGHAVTLDTDHERNSAPTPIELLLIALGSCTGVDVVGILKKKRERVTGYKVEVLGKRRSEHPRSFERMQVHHIVTGHNVSEKSVAQAIELSESKYCSVAATLKPTVQILSSYSIVEELREEND